jgi:hypothetical protein
MASASGEGSLVYQEANEGMWAAITEAINMQLQGVIRSRRRCCSSWILNWVIGFQAFRLRVFRC